MVRALTLAALGACALLIARPTSERTQLLTFVAGTALGYFLERWGTTRGCWTYYTRETPPFFAVLAHGMAAVAFWRVLDAFDRWGQLVAPLLRRLARPSSRAASRT